MRLLYLVVAAGIVIPLLTTIISGALEVAKVEHIGFIKAFWMELKSDIVLILKTAFVHKPSIRTLKHLQQLGLYFVEIFTVCGLFLIIEQFLYPVSPDGFWYEILIRFLTTYTAYQILVFSIMNLANSARRDEWLALVRILKLKKLYDATGEPEACRELNRRIKECLNPYTFMTGKPKMYVQEVRDGVSGDYLDYLLILAEHQVEALGSYWHFSFLLDAIK